MSVALYGCGLVMISVDVGRIGPVSLDSGLVGLVRFEGDSAGHLSLAWGAWLLGFTPQLDLFGALERLTSVSMG